MDPLVISALGGLLVDALSGIVGNRADAAVNTAWHAIVEGLKKGGKPVNHDLKRAVVRSFILALNTICDDCINEMKAKKREYAEDIHWLEEKRKSLNEELKQTDKAEDFEPSLESFEEIELLVLPDGSIAHDRMNSVKAKLIDAATRDGVLTRCYKEKVEKELFELMCAYFAEEIKTNARVRNIFEGQLLSQIDVRLQGQQLIVERIEASLRDLSKASPLIIGKHERMWKALTEVDRYFQYGIAEELQNAISFGGQNAIPLIEAYNTFREVKPFLSDQLCGLIETALDAATAEFNRFLDALRAVVSTPLNSSQRVDATRFANHVLNEALIAFRARLEPVEVAIRKLLC